MGICERCEYFKFKGNSSKCSECIRKWRQYLEGNTGSEKRMWACVRCEVAFPELPAKEGIRENCSFCGGELKLLRVVKKMVI